MSTVKTVLKTLDSYGFYQALQALEEVEGVDRETRLLAVAYARRAQHLMTDPRSVNALDVAERYANGLATEQELHAVMDAARDSIATADDAATDAARGAAAAVRAGVIAAAAEALDAAADEHAERDWQIAELRRVCECIEAGTDPYPKGGA